MDAFIDTRSQVLKNSWHHPLGPITAEELSRAESFVGRGCGIIWTNSSGKKEDTYGQLCGLYQKDNQSFYIVDDILIPRSAIHRRPGILIDEYGSHEKLDKLPDCLIIKKARSSAAAGLYNQICMVVSQKHGLEPVQLRNNDSVVGLGNTSIPVSEELKDLRAFAKKFKPGEIAIFSVAGKEIEASSFQIDEKKATVTLLRTDGKQEDLLISSIKDCVVKMRRMQEQT